MKGIFDLMDENIKQLNDIKLKLHDHSEEDKAINIILDDSDTQNPVFVEIESDDGKSINIGERSTNSDGLTVIRISISDIRNYTHYDI